MTTPLLPPRSAIGMIHVDALPGAPFSRRAVREIAAAAAREARLLADAGFDACIVENMHDRPYVNAPHAPATVAAMTLCTRAVREAAPSLVCGVQILSFGHEEALAVALATDAHFIRVENFVYAHVADEGLLPTAAAGALLRLRQSLNATHIRLMCDIKKKHASHALTADLTIGDTAHAAEFFGADGLIVTGAFTAAPVSQTDLTEARAHSTLPVWVGSGATPEQLPALFTSADAVIVGSFIKHTGSWDQPPDPARCRQIIEARDRFRAQS